jgi:DNA-directed RNA polymerase subunit RPC12/RpoP
MSEFKYACPVCGQHIKCDSSQSGSVMECPTCFQKITVPQAPATDDPKFIITGTKVGERPAPKIADGSSSPVPAEKHLPLAVVVVLLVLIIAAGAAVFAFRGKIFRSAGAGTNQVASAAVQAQTPATNKTNPAPPQPVPVAPPASDTNWTLNLDAVTIPDSLVAGYIHGKALVPERMFVNEDRLTIRTAEFPPAVGVTIYLRPNPIESLFGKSVVIKTNAANAPVVNLRWKNAQGHAVGQPERAGYALRIEFGQPAGNTLPGKIYLCTPDETKSYIAGTFNAEIRKPKPPKPKS